MSDTPRVQPFYCPYCGEQDLRPSATTGWHCPICDRRFELSFLGLGAEEAGSSSEAVAPDLGFAERSGDRREHG
jgi:hypothetical protein